MSLLMDYIWGEKLSVHFILVVSFNLKCIFIIVTLISANYFTI